MATYDLVFNIAKGKFAYYAGLPASGDRLVAIPLEATGIVTAATMRDYDTVAAVLAGATNEQTDLGRKIPTTVSVTVDDSGDKTVLNFDDIVWAGPTGDPTAALLIAYDATGSDAGSALLPLLCLDFTSTPGGGDITYQVNASGAADAA